jgi:hypothetical protein
VCWLGGVVFYGCCSTSCFAGFDDSPRGFYTVFRDLFAAVDSDEEKFGTFNLERSRASAPSFGTSVSPVDDVWSFYTYWEQFNSRMTFSWVDDYDPAEVCPTFIPASTAHATCYLLLAACPRYMLSKRVCFVPWVHAACC